MVTFYDNDIFIQFIHSDPFHLLGLVEQKGIGHGVKRKNGALECDISFAAESEWERIIRKRVKDISSFHFAGFVNVILSTSWESTL